MAETATESRKPARKTPPPPTPAAGTATEAQKPRPKRHAQTPGPATEGIPGVTAPISTGNDGTADPDFFEWLKRFSPAEWSEHVFMYLYRTAPFIDLGKKGEWRIERYTKPVDSHDIMLSHGSGGYKLILDRWDATTNRTIVLKTHYFTICNMNYPPKVPYGDWLNKPENQSWVWSRPYLEQQLEKNGAKGPATAGGTALKEIMEAIQILRPEQSPGEQKTLAEMVIKSMEKNADQLLALADPAKALAQIQTIVAMIAPQKGEGDTVLKLITSQLDRMSAELVNERKANSDLLARLLDPQNRKSIKDEILEMKEIIEVIRPQRNGASAGTDWGSVATEVGKKALEVGGMIVQGIMNRPAQPGVAPRQPQPHAIQPQLPAPTQPAAASPTVTTPEDTVMMVQQISNQFGPLFDMIAPFLQDQFTKGLTGMDFREWFIETYGTHTYNSIRAMSAKTITEVIELRKTQAPEHVQPLLAQLQPPAQLAEFVEEFLSDRPVPDAEGNDEPDAPAAPTAETDLTPEPFRDPNAVNEF